MDDEPAILEIAQSYLESEGDILAQTATSAIEALRRMSDWRYDVIISDYFMPGSDGMDLLNILRRGGDDIPFILLAPRDFQGMGEGIPSPPWCSVVDKSASLRDRFLRLRPLVREVVNRKHSPERESAGTGGIHSPPGQIRIPGGTGERGGPEESAAGNQGTSGPHINAKAAIPDRLFTGKGIGTIGPDLVPGNGHRTPAASRNGVRFSGGLKLVSANVGLREASTIGISPNTAADGRHGPAMDGSSQDRPNRSYLRKNDHT